MWCARETTLTFSVMYLSLLTSEVYLLVNLFSKLYELVHNMAYYSIFGRLFFLKNPSFKIVMSGRVGVGRHPRFTFWLTFWLTVFQSCMLPLFFSGLLSYLVGMRRMTSRCVTCKRDNSHFVLYVLISPDRLCSYLVEMKMRTSRHVVYKRDNSHFLHYVLISFWHPRFTFWLTFFQSCM